MQTQATTSSGLLIGGETAGEILAALLDWAAEEERRRLGRASAGDR